MEQEKYLKMHLSGWDSDNESVMSEVSSCYEYLRPPPLTSEQLQGRTVVVEPKSKSTSEIQQSYPSTSTGSSLDWRDRKLTVSRLKTQDVESMVKSQKCELCCILIQSAKNAQDHILSKYHMDKQRFCVPCSKNIDDVQNHLISEEHKQKKETYCFICNIRAPTGSHLSQHKTGSKHKNKVAGLKLLETVTVKGNNNSTGPGNNLNSGQPVDIDDLIALQHDIEYYLAQTPQQISIADKKAAQDFFFHFLTELNFEALCGWVGLSIKQYLENKVGLLYPSLPDNSMQKAKQLHKGQQQYSDRIKRLAEEYQNRKKAGEKLTWHEFLRKSASTPNPNQAGPSGVSAKPVTPSSEEVLESPPESVMDPREQARRLETGDLPMELDTIREENSGGIGARASIGTSSSGYTRIPRSLRLKSFSLNFGKSRIFYSYAYAFKTIINPQTSGNPPVSKGDHVYYTTGLAMLPNDLIGFYLNQYEWGLLFQYGLVKVKKCSVTVVPQGLRTAFDTGSTLSGTATSEHCALGISNVGLNQKYYCRYAGYNSDASSPMVPTAIKDISIDDIFKKYYGDQELKINGPMCLGVPRHVDMYFVAMTNSNKTLAGYAKHVNGTPQLDKHLDRFNFMHHIGEKIIDWEYYPQFGYLNVKAHDIPYLIGESDTVYGNNTFAHSSQKITITCQKDGVTSTKINQNTEAHITNNPIDRESLGYYNIDGNKVFAPFDNRGTKGIHKVVPLIHFGLLPTPALNPSTDNENFQNSCAYWSVNCQLILEYNLESCYNYAASSPAHALNDEVVFIPNRDKNNYGVFNPISLESYGS